MTTIIADRRKGLMYSDTQIQINHASTRDKTEYTRLNTHFIDHYEGKHEHLPAVMALAGALNLMPRARTMLRRADAARSVVPGEARAGLLVLAYDADLDSTFMLVGEIDNHSFCYTDVSNEDYWAVGSGGEYAMGAMYASSDCRLAMDAACRFDPHTGVGVDVTDVRFAPVVKPRWWKL